MPGRNGTGPLGQGPLTGGRRGLCNAAAVTGVMGALGTMAGRFLGRGFGRGMGFGRGFGYGWNNPPAPMPAQNANPPTGENAAESDRQMLQQQLTELSRQVADIQEKLNNLK